MARKRIGAFKTSAIQNTLMDDVVPAAVGYIVGEVLTKQLNFLSSNPTVGNVVKLAGGVVLASQGGGLLTRMGVGLAANGAVGFVIPALRNAGIARLLPADVSSFAVAGTPEMLNEPVAVKVQ